ncbi:hypothetical protein C8R42DRAFT_723275 [Lentinula raphanica]|nr:hypothetical protein C8R42DRAFT_723275 [Lentinula raphanica]
MATADDGANAPSLSSHTSPSAADSTPPLNATSKPKRKRSKRTSKSKNSKTSTAPIAASSSSPNNEPGTTATGTTATTASANPGSVGDENNDEEDAPRRRGHQGNFRGARLKFLEASLQDYVKAKPRGPCFARICTEWFEKWPWHDNDKQPAQFDVLESTDASISADARSELVEERKKVKEAIQVNGKNQLERWFWRNAKKGNSSVPLQSTPLAPLLRKALGFAGGAPRRGTLYKVWMKRPENKSKVQEAVQARLAEEHVPKAMLLKLRCDVAEALFEEEPEDIKQEIEEHVEKIYEQQLEVFKRITTGETVTLEELGEEGNAEELREVCRESLTKFLQPLLDLLRLYTGLKFCLLAGAPPPTDDDDFFLLTINSGETPGLNPQTFQNWNNEYFTKNVMALFMLFLCNQNPKDVLGEPGLIHPDVSTAGSHAAPTQDPENPLDDPSLVRMPEKQPAQTHTKTSKKRQRKSRRTRAKVTETESDDEGESFDDEEKYTDEEGQTIYLRDMKGRLIETRDQDLILQHFEAESTPEPDEPLPDILRDYLASMLTQTRRELIAMLNSQSGVVRKHNVRVLTMKAETWKAGQVVRSPSIHRDINPGSKATGTTTPNIPLSTISTVPAVVRTRCGSVPLHTLPSVDNIFQLDDHETRLASSKPSRTVNTPVRFSSVPIHLPADAGNFDLSQLSAHSKTPPEPVATQLSSSENPDSDSFPRHRPKPRPLPRRVRATLNEKPDSIGSPTPNPSNEPMNSESAANLTQTSDVDLNDCPTWLTRAIEALGGLDQDVTQWNQALSALVTLERSYDFRDPSGKKASFSAAKGVRPPLVEWYFKNRKNVEATLNHSFDDLTAEKLGRSLGMWWSVINPEWRERDHENQIVPRGQGEGSWDGVHRPGQCGMITVLTCVRWWYLRASDDKEEMEKCLIFLSDVQAVIEDMAYERGAYDGRLKRKAPSSIASNNPRPVRRTRVN